MRLTALLHRRKATRGALHLRLSVVSALGTLPLVLLVLMAPASASAEVQFGTLSNFDVFNDTGEETHGFEIELEGISSADISYTFGAPYQFRYGTPKLIDFPGGVYVRYESPYDAGTKTFAQGTPVAPSPITPTLGHECWTGGSSGYSSSGCEHFGLGLIKNPTKTVYRWLVADPAKPGGLMDAGTKVGVPAPKWSVIPPSPAQPVPVVRAVVDAPEPAPQASWGEAVWVKVYVTESPVPAQLNHLLTDDPAVPQEAAQTETEWVLLQQEKGVANAAAALASEKPLKAGEESVTRRYELYEYTGSYDAETHEALPAINDNTPGPGELGEYVGAQMAAANNEGGQPAPTVKRLSAKTGPAAGGTTVKITGTGFTGASAVRFGSTDATSFTVNSATSITAVSPAGTAGIVDVSVITPNGASGSFINDRFNYGTPTITGVSPNAGAKAGGTSVTVSGSGFAPGVGGTIVKFGTKLGGSVECSSTTTCTVVAPAATKAATVDVTAKAGGKTSAKTAADHYTYS
ncbi:MAG: hypothetical protein JWL67_1501 [Solirubrobacterales bacterium]|nr:hypothetical protein [Solirubrobacterales bacterium]